jgi:methionyl-tRNA synthetase
VQPYVDEQAPWTLRKTDPARMERVLADAVRLLSGIWRWRFRRDANSFGEVLDALCIPRRRGISRAGDDDGPSGRTIPPVLPRLEMPEEARDAGR